MNYITDHFGFVDNFFLNTGDFAKTKGILGIEGHRSVGGFRASLYNALPIESVSALVECMKEFANKY